MKPTIIFKLLALAFALLLPSCATESVTETKPDGTVTVTNKSAPAIKDNTKEFIADVVWAWSPRQRPVHPQAIEPAK